MSARNLNRVHLWVGGLGLLAFLVSGQYMDRALGHLAGMPDGPRLMYRSAHIYLLFSSLLNVLRSRVPQESNRWILLNQLGSVLLLLSPFMIGWGFFQESAHLDLHRPWVRYGIYFAFAGTYCSIVTKKANIPNPSA